LQPTARGATISAPRLKPGVAVPTMRLHQFPLSGDIIERGFLLYAWRIEQGSREFFKVERTGRTMRRRSWAASGNGRRKYAGRYNSRSLRAGSVNVDFDIRARGPYTPFPPVARHQRHLDESPRAMVGTRTATLEDGQRQVGKLADVPSQSEAAPMLNVSETSIRNAGRGIDSGLPGLVRAVDRGDAAVSLQSS
jgi:hypothetical protein